MKESQASSIISLLAVMMLPCLFYPHVDPLSFFLFFFFSLLCFLCFLCFFHLLTRGSHFLV
ncbi:hypothetical protein V8C34DRAFT_286020 [Trichoderma compactum]